MSFTSAMLSYKEGGILYSECLLLEVPLYVHTENPDPCTDPEAVPEAVP